MEKHKLLLMIGKSASGKDTIAKEISKKGYQSLIPCTTRPMRVGESEGDPYHFISEHDVDEKMIGKTSFSTAHGIWYYGFEKQELDPNADYVAVLNPGQIKELYEYHSKTHEVIILLIEAKNEETRIIKAIEREEKGKCDYAELCRRFVSDAKDFSKLETNVWKFERILCDEAFLFINDYATDPVEMADYIISRISEEEEDSVECKAIRDLKAQAAEEVRKKIKRQLTIELFKNHVSVAIIARSVDATIEEVNSWLTDTELM